MYKIMVLLYYYNIHQVLCKEFISVFFLIYRHVTVHMEINRDLVKQVRTPPVRPADGVVGCVYESFVPGFGIAVWRRRYCGFVLAEPRE